MTAFRVRAASIAVCFVLTSCGQGGGPQDSGSEQGVSVLPVDHTIRQAPGEFDDELAHLVVTPSPALAEELGLSIGSGGAMGADGATSPQDRLRVPDDEIDMVPSDAVLEFRNGIPGYTNQLGAFVPLTDGSAAPDSSAPSTSGDPIVEELLADPSVESVLAVGDGSYGVVTSDPDNLDGERFDVREDVVLGLFEEPYEQYQWALTNTGTNLDGALSSPPAQTEGSDIDGAEALALAAGNGIVVAVIDSGVDFSHPDLADSTWTNTGELCGNGVDDDANGYVDDCTGWDFGYNDNASYNPGTDAHGTHVAGIITANINGAGVAGIAPEAKVMDLNVGGPGGISGTSIAGAVRYAADNGADVINMSLGTQLGTPRAAVAVIESAVTYALEQGVLVVVAAGNDGVNLDASPVYPASLALPGMLVVGASTPSDDRASFSNYSENQVNVFAPGHYILSTMPGGDYQFMSGTSQASPLSAGAAALVMQQYPSFDALAVINHLASTSNVLDAFDGLSANGGRINALNAIEGTIPEPVVVEPTELTVLVSGVAQATNELDATVNVTLPTDWFPEAYHWELTILTSIDGTTYALPEFPVIIDGSAAATDSRGSIRLGDGGPLVDVGVVAGVPDGDYAFVIEAVADAEPDIRFGDAHVVSFAVAANEVPTDPSPSPTDPGSPSTDTPSSETPSTETPTGGGGGTSEGSDDSPSSGSTAPSDPQPDSGSGSTDSGSDDSGSGGGSTGGGSTGGGSSSGSGTSGGGSTSGGTGGSTDVDPGGATAPSNPGSETDGTTSGSGSTGGGTTDPNVPVPGSDQAQDGDWSVYRFSNQVGLINVINVVYLMGEFPAEPDVWFGDQPGTVVYYSPEFIIVDTPVRSEPGVVDVTLRRTGTGIVLTLPAAYGFVDPNAQSGDTASGGTSSGDTSSGGTTSGGSDSGSSGSGGSGSGSTDSGSGDSGSGDSGSGDSGSGDSGSGDGGSGSDSPSSSEPPTQTDPVGRQSRSGLGDLVDLPNGLRGVPLVGDDPTQSVSRCSADPCAAS